jgi:hypothetical protein
MVASESMRSIATIESPEGTTRRRDNECGDPGETVGGGTCLIRSARWNENDRHEK